jgi:regulator of sirC expression with transglutaminase-like and TPR domain
MKNILLFIILIVFVSCSEKNQDSKRNNHENELSQLLDSLYKQEKLGELFMLTDSLLTDNPENQVALAHRGYIFYHYNKKEQAIKEINRAFEFGYDSGVLRAIRGTIYAGNKNYQLALEDFNTYSKMGYSEFMVSRNRAVIYEDLNQCK